MSDDEKQVQPTLAWRVAAQRVRARSDRQQTVLLECMKHTLTDSMNRTPKSVPRANSSVRFCVPGSIEAQW